MKILFLDIDGVVNCHTTTQRHRGFIGIDPYMAFLVGKIVLDTDCQVVLSSSWRHSQDGIDEVEAQVTKILDTTTIHTRMGTTRGKEIQEWLDVHPEVTRYAILDDDRSMLENQLPNFFNTSWLTGITPDIANSVTEHLRG